MVRMVCREELISSQMLKSLDGNFKSALLEFAQARGLGAPRYNLLKEEGPDHDRTFTIEVLIGDESCGAGMGKTKKAAEQAAAEQAYESLKYKKPNQDEGDTDASLIWWLIFPIWEETVVMFCFCRTMNRPWWLRE